MCLLLRESRAAHCTSLLRRPFFFFLLISSPYKIYIFARQSFSYRSKATNEWLQEKSILLFSKLGVPLCQPNQKPIEILVTRIYSHGKQVTIESELVNGTHAG